ncbi:MAG: DUF2130 domain-containing protein [Planctomycetia bacterium]|nr:DUF2130 domain-containing protein [Planctomycetia bacterium]
MTSPADPTITCPHCKGDVRLTESLAAPLVEATRAQYEAKLQAERAAIAKAEAEKARLSLKADLDRQARDLADLKGVIADRDAKLADAQKAQAEAIRKQRELDDAKRELDLSVEKKVQESLATARAQAKQEAESDLKLKMSEKEQTILAMQKQIEDLKRRAEQGSQQLQGEVQELELEGVLKHTFPGDVFTPVAKGEFGGDVVQAVARGEGLLCGTILWESKRTKNWSDGWLVKLRDDQRAAKADLAVIVSQALPKGIETFGHVDGVWVTSTRTFLPLAVALRHTLLELALARQAGEGQQTKMELVYQYLTGPRFRQRVTAIMEKFEEMSADLVKERATMTKLWARREMQIQAVLTATAGMYGDLQGIAGQAIETIEALDISRITGPHGSSEKPS